MNDTTAAPPFAPLSPLEISGALCARVIHDLSNHISGILGNAEYAQSGDADPANLQKALQAITLSANNAGKLLGQCLPLQQFIAREAFPYPAPEQAADIAEAAGLAPGWRVNAPPRLTGEIRVQPRWLTSAVWQLAREADTQHGEIDFACGPAVFPVVWSGQNPNAQQSIELFQITLRYRADQPLFENGVKINPERFALCAAHEIIRRLKGQILTHPKPPGRQEIFVLLPLANA
jgi:hypothetical protein